jgi:tRNA dimethylallyltransferase
LLDVADPAKGFSAVEFKRLAQVAIDDITARSKLPIMVGGTGLYIDSIIYDYSFLPPSDPALRAALNAMDLKQLLARADELELDTTGIDLRNKRRIIRLIENNGVRPSKHAMRDNTLILGLQVPREELHSRIERRVDAMLAAGLEQEALGLSQKYGWDVEPMKGIGYGEWAVYGAGERSLAEIRQRIIKDTVDLAKRQRTWFKRNNSIQWLSDRSNAVEIVTTFLNK